MGKPFHEHLEGPVYSCGVCRVPLAKQASLASKVRYAVVSQSSSCPHSTSFARAQSFNARSGKAYLFHSAANVSTGGETGMRNPSQFSSGSHSLALLNSLESSSSSPSWGPETWAQRPGLVEGSPFSRMAAWHSHRPEGALPVLAGPKEERMMTTGLHLVSGKLEGGA
jgi:hypothetical protein